jgi:hypothetical protein
MLAERTPPETHMQPCYARRLRSASLPILTCVAIALTFCPHRSFAQSTPLVGLVVQGKKYVGRLLWKDAESTVLLRRDGSLSKYPTADIETYLRFPKPFRPYSADELSARLEREFPGRYAVRATEHYLVVCPADSGYAWATAFERIYSRFNHHFESRGIELSSPEFPLIVVVLETRAEFDEHLARTQLVDQASVTGFYSLQSNRIITFDQPSSARGEAQADRNLSTIAHEATHQLAFNQGVHSRFRPVPRWASEGLAAIFEAPGVHDPAHHSALADRWPVGYSNALRDLIAHDQLPGKIKRLVSDDSFFDDDPATAYAVAWGLSYYLAENQADSYRDYLRATTAGDEFSQVNPQVRFEEFCRHFGDDFRRLELRLQAYYERAAAEASAVSSVPPAL